MVSWYYSYFLFCTYVFFTSSNVQVHKASSGPSSPIPFPQVIDHDTRDICPSLSQCNHISIHVIPKPSTNTSTQTPYSRIHLRILSSRYRRIRSANPSSNVVKRNLCHRSNPSQTPTLCSVIKKNPVPHIHRYIACAAVPISKSFSSFC